MRILIADDDANISKAVGIFLGAQGYKTFAVANGEEALLEVKKGDVSLVLLDIMMPKMDGIEALAAIREFSQIPIVMLTAKSEDVDKVLGLGMGADDYITKPFNTMELIARVKAQLRRASWAEDNASKSAKNDGGNELTIGEITIDYLKKMVKKSGEVIALTPREYDILRFLMENKNQVFSPKEIYTAIWKDDLVNENAVAVHVRHLREKIEINPSEPRYIIVNWGHGYMFNE